MRAFIIFVVFLGCFMLTLADKACTKQSDCEEDECCLDTLFFRRAYCTPRYGAGKSCLYIALYKEDKDMYYFGCPCVKMYECLGKGTLENGQLVVKDPKCIMPTF